MAIIYSYPTVLPTANDLILGTDVDQAGKPTKNFTIQSIVDIVQQGATGLAATLALGNDANNQAAIGFTNLIGTGTVTFGGFTDGTMTITTGTGAGFTSITSTDFVGNITGVVKAGSSIAGTVTGVTQNAGDNSTKLATTAYVDGKIDPSILTFAGTSGGNQTVNLAAQTFSLLGTASQIESVSTAQTITFRFPAAGVVLPDGSTATTQAATDDSTKVATTAFVRDYDDLQDLDFSGTTGTGAVVLNSQTLAIAGTANQVVTSAAGQTLTIALTNPVVRDLTGNVTGILKDGSSIETTVTGVTQIAGNNSTRLATTAYVDAASGAKTLDYAGDATGPFALNLSTDDLEFNGDTNITVTATAVAANKGIVTIDLNNDVGISGTMTAGTFTDGTFTGSAGTYTGYASITSTAFVGALTGNATTATALAAPGTIQLLSGSGATQGVASNAITYTSGGNVQLTTSLANTTVTSKTLLNLPTPTSSAIAAGDTVLEAMAKLQGQITASGGGGALAYEGAWRASVTAVANGAVSSSTALVITTADANLVKGTVVEGTGITGTVRIDSITGTSITLDTAITIANGITLTMSPPGGAITGATAGTAASLTTPANKLSGRFYICDTSGKAEPNAAVPWAAATTPNEWAVGDWVVYISNGTAADEWQKIDQSNEIFGSGSTNKIAKWTASNTLGTGLIEDDGTTVTIGANGNLTVLGDTILGDDAAADTITLNGPTTFESTGIFKKGIALGAAGTDYGNGTKVLTSSGAAGSPPTWTTPTVGTLTNITAGNGITVALNADVSNATIGIDYVGTDNAILSATDISTGTIALTDQIWFNDINTGTVTNTLKYAPVSKLKDIINTYSWDLDVNGGTPVTIADTNQVGFNNGAGILQTISSKDVTTALRYDDSDNSGTIKNFIEAATTATVAASDFLIFGDQAGGSAVNSVKKVTLANLPFAPTISGTQYTIPMFATTSTLGDSMITQNAGGTIAIVGGELKTTTFKINGQQVLGGSKVSLGTQANATGGTYSVGVGAFAGKSQTDSYSVAIGAFSHGGNEENSPDGTNTAVGSFALEKITTGDKNTAVGYRAGVAVTTGDNNIYIGDNAGYTSTTQSNEIVIGGDNTQGNGSNTITIGASGHTVFFGGVNGINIGSSAKRWGDIYGALINVSGDGTFGGNVQVDGNLTVGGQIIHSGGGIPSGGSVSAKGGTFAFNEDITGNTGGNVLFSVRRPATGALALRLMLTSGDAVAESRTKIFDVCKSFGSATVFNKTIDSGPNTNTPANDFTISFTPPSTGVVPTATSASGQKVISGIAGGGYVVGMGITCNVSNKIPSGAVVTEAKSGQNQITIDQNLIGEVNSSMVITATSNDLIVCYATGTPATQDISVTLDLGYDNNTTATVSRKQSV